MLPFEPDNVLVNEVIASPNHGQRAANRSPDMLLLHYTGMPSPEEALERLCSAASVVSCHYYISEQGRIFQLVPEELRAWHAGEGSWAGETDINSCSIGIEIDNPGHDYGYPDFSKRQIAAVTALGRAILRKRNIPAERVLAHSDVAPSRKQDPGEKFPWGLMHKCGIGHWTQPAPLTQGPRFEIGDSGDAVRSFQAALQDYGYGVPTHGEFDVHTQDVVLAFQRHFRPEQCDGSMDSSTLKTLGKLLETRPGARGRFSPDPALNAPPSPNDRAEAKPDADDAS